MPIFEGRCENSDCPERGRLYEYLLRNSECQDPECPRCASQLERQFSMPNAIWVKDLGQYCGENKEGHYAYARDPEDNKKVIKKFIKTRKDQKEFCKQFGYHDPNDLPSAMTSDAQGKERNTRGEPGTWI